MLEINGTKISLTRGDTLRALLSLFKDGSEYTPEEGDTIRFALKHRDMNSGMTDFKDKNPLIVKEIPTDTLEFVLDPEDTKNLQFGKYVYDIEITFANGDVDTFIPNATFEILPEVD